METENILPETPEVLPARKPSPGEEAFEWIVSVVLAVLAATFIFTFLFRTTVVSGSSMVNTLHDGDILISSRLFWEPTFGDIVTVNQPNFREEVLIKRVIATEGQTVYVDVENNKVYVDGEEVDNSFIAEPMDYAFGNEGPVTVPEGYVFVCGDNRNHSLDSRTPEIGFIRTDYISGQIVLGIRPFGFSMIYGK